MFGWHQVGGFGTTIAVIILLRHAAPRLGLLDHPGGRRLHAAPVPLVGGIAILCGLVVSMALRGTIAPASIGLVLGAVLAVAGGTLDDRFELPASVKLLIQIAAAAMLTEFGGTLLTHIGALFSFRVQGLGATLAMPFTILALVGVMNAMNMIDGADGLAGGVALGALFWFAMAASAAALPDFVSLIGSLFYGVAAYLGFNAWRPLAGRYQVFLGDAGSFLLGLLLAWFAICLAMAPIPAFKPVTAVWILAVPISDSLSLMVRRVMRGRSPFSPDREHLHHLLGEAGLSAGRASALIVGLNFALGGLALGAERFEVPEHWMFFSGISLFAAYTLFSENFFRKRRSKAE